MSQSIEAISEAKVSKIFDLANDMTKKIVFTLSFRTLAKRVLPIVHSISSL